MARPTAPARAIIVMCALAATVGAPATSAPVVAPGFPVVAPDTETVAVAPDGRILIAGWDGTAVGATLAAAYTGHGRQLWRTGLGPWCGNCDGPMRPHLTADGLFQPLGFAGDGVGALDAMGRPTTPTCPGTPANDGHCYTVTFDRLDPGQPYGPRGLRIARVGGWSTTDHRLPSGHDDDQRQAEVVVSGGVVIVRADASTLAGLASTDGRLLWTRQIPHGTVGPLNGGGRATIAIPHPGAAVEWIDSTSGAAAQRVALPGLTGVPVADARRGSVIASVGSRSRLAAGGGRVRRITPDGRLHPVAARAGVGDPVAVGPDGAIFTHHRGRATLTSLTSGGRVRWRLPLPGAMGDSSVPRPALGHYGNGDVVVATGGGQVITHGLLLRIRARPGATRPISRAQLRVRPGRARLDGARTRCQDLAGQRCAPTSPRGAVGELHLPSRPQGGRVEITLRRAASPGQAVTGWRAVLAPVRAERVWFAIDSDHDDRCAACTGSGIRPGPHLVRAQWRHGDRIHMAQAPLTVLPADSP